MFLQYKCNIYVWNYSQSHQYLVSTVNTDGLVLKHQGISSPRVDYAPMHFQLLMG